MSWEIWFTLAIVVTVLVMLATTPAPTEVVLLGAMIVLSIVGVITPTQALSGFSSPGVMTIAALYVVIAGLRETGHHRLVLATRVRPAEEPAVGAGQADRRRAACCRP